MNLTLSEKPDAVRNAATFLLRAGNLPERQLPMDTSILDIYNQSAHDLLILGAPGAGKSTLLLELAQQLVELVTQNEETPLPVILQLSSWAVKRLLLQEWIVEQLTQVYDIPHLVSEHWVHKDAILPLLDGLDEMDESARPACIAAINAYHQTHLNVPLVVCSHLADYDVAAQSERLALQSAVVVQPLTSQQVDAYLQRRGSTVAALRHAVKKNPVLQEVATTPLMLSVLMLTYQGTTMRELPSKEALLQQQVWMDYVARMVQRKGDVARYPLERTRHQLNWLAHQIRSHQQPIFYAENLQSEWLAHDQQRGMVRLAINLPAIVLGGCVSLLVLFFTGRTANHLLLLQLGLLGAFVGGTLSQRIIVGTTDATNRLSNRKLAYFRNAVLLSMLFAVSYGLLLGPPNLFNQYTSSYSLSDWVRDGSILALGSGFSFWIFQMFLDYLPKQRISVPHRHSILKDRLVWINALAPPYIWRAATALGLGIYLSYCLSNFQDNSQSSVFTYIQQYAFILEYAFILGILITIVIFIYVALASSLGSLRFVERIHWTGHYLLQSGHLRTSLIITVLTFLYAGLSSGLSLGLIMGQVDAWILQALYQGMRQERIEDQDRQQFNQGILRSLRNGLCIGLIGAILIGIISALSSLFGSWLGDTLSNWLGGGFFGASGSFDMIGNLRLILDPIDISIVLFAGIGVLWSLSGGLTVLRHYVFRWLLARSHHLPWHAQAFLDDACARILLQRVGGGYRFIHRLLLDYFADLDQMGAPIAPSETSQIGIALPPSHDPLA